MFMCRAFVCAMSCVHVSEASVSKSSGRGAVLTLDAEPFVVYNVIAEPPVGETIGADPSVILSDLASLKATVAEYRRAFAKNVGNALRSMTGGLNNLKQLRGTASSASFLTSAAAVSESSVSSLVDQASAGGYAARSALRQLTALAADPGARAVVEASGAAGVAATMLKRPSSDTTMRALSGTLLALVSGMPVAASTSDEVTGSVGRVDVVLPRPSRVYGADRAEFELTSGVSPANV